MVSGSQVTGLFVKSTEWLKSSDLNVYVNMKKEPAVDSMLKQNGYYLHTETNLEEFVEVNKNGLLNAIGRDEVILRGKYSFSTIASVKEYHNNKGKVIQAIASYRPLMDIILRFHSSNRFLHFCSLPGLNFHVLN